MKNGFAWVCVAAVGLVVVTALLTNTRYVWREGFGRPISDKWTGRVFAEFNKYTPPALPPMVDTGLWVLGALGVGGGLYVLRKRRG